MSRCRRGPGGAASLPPILKKLERDGLALHPPPQVRHEDEIWRRPASQERVTVSLEDRSGVLGIQLELAHRGPRVRQEPGPERVVGLEREETAIEPVGGRRREAIVRLVVHGRGPDGERRVIPATRRRRSRDATRARSSTRPPSPRRRRRGAWPTS